MLKKRLFTMLPIFDHYYLYFDYCLDILAKCLFIINLPRAVVFVKAKMTYLLHENSA
jgi:hypothetical protein